MDTKRCAKCGSEYDAAYDGCPRCANSWWEALKPFFITGVILVMLSCCCITMSML